MLPLSCFRCSDFAIKQINDKDGFYISEKQDLDILDAFKAFINNLL